MSSMEIAHCSSSNRVSSYRSKLLKSGNILRRIEKTFEKFQEKPLPPLFKSRLAGPSNTWKVFSRLQAASTYADSCTKDCMIFSFEEKVGNVGQRKFLVAHPEHFWHNHRLRLPEERCSYEVIRENFPCKLYFDLEYYNAFNSTKNGNDMTKTFVKCVIASMYEQHGLILGTSDFLWLDSSNDSKFSCHLILQMKDVAFRDNIQAGIFVQILLSTLRKKIEDKVSSNGLWPSSEEIKALIVTSKKKNEVFFCDEGVYSRNRNFRTYLSTKYGKKSPLIVSPHNEYITFNKESKEESIFYSSLITHFRNQDISNLLNYEENIPPSLPSQLRSVKNKKFGESGCGSSPFPELDTFVSKIVTDNLVVGFVRKWTYFSKEQKIIYDIGNYRYCGNVSRHHKSNNIRIVVDTRNKCFYQICLDPECRQNNYQSDSRAIPDEVLFAHVPDDFFEDDCFSQLKSDENKENSGGKSVNNFKVESQRRLDKEEIFELHVEEVNDNQTSQETDWEAFFCENDSTCFEYGMKQEECVVPSPDLVSTEHVWSDSPSLEEETLMAEVADAAEANMMDIFDEETIF